MNLAAAAQARYTTKAFDPTRQIPQDQIGELLSALRASPSSVNSQPWHFVVASDAAGKQRIARSTQGSFAYNEAKVLNASHVIVLCARTDITPEHLDAVLEQESQDGRFQIDGARAGQQKSRLSYVNLHRFEQKDLTHWMEKQVYLSLGTLLLGAAALGIDATPMEGFDFRALDEELDLRGKGYTSVVLCALGYRSEQDFNARLPKSRLPQATVMSFI